MKKKLLFFYLFSTLFFIEISAQQNPIYTQFGMVQGLLNPAALKTDFHLNQGDYTTYLSINSRQHWVGLSNSNHTQSIHFEQIYANQGISFIYGGQLVNDKNGRISNTGLYGRLGAIINEDLDWGGLSFGLNIGLIQHRLDLRNTKARESGDILAQALETNIHPSIGLGAYFYRIDDRDNILHVGLSIPEIFKLDDINKEELLYLTKDKHYYFHTGYTLTGNDAHSYLDLGYQMYYVRHASLFFGFNAKYQFNDTLWLGIGYSTQGALHPEFGVSFGDSKKIRLGLALDIPFNDVIKFGNSLELNLLIAFGK